MFDQKKNFDDNLDCLINQAKENFFDIFNDQPQACGFAPGRVNLIGDHTDYNDGFVLPMTIPRYTLIVGSKSTSKKCRVVTLNTVIDENKRDISFDLNNIKKSTDCLWINYLFGVLEFFPVKSKIPAFNAIVLSSVPISQGLSSSASLEVSFFEFLLELVTQEGVSISISKEEKAKICQKAENEFGNVPCGIMDQLIAYIGNKDSVVLIDCRNLSYDYIPIKILFDDGFFILVISSNIHHDHANNEYAKRRKTCEFVANLLGKSSLRDVNMKELETSINTLPKEAYLSCRHVITETERTISAAEALKKKDYDVFGILMVQSHFSLKNDYVVSCSKIDELVDYTNEFNSVLGSRMTGGGFGGCTVTLLKKESLNQFIDHISKKYKDHENLEYYIFFNAGKSAGNINLKSH